MDSAINEYKTQCSNLYDLARRFKIPMKVLRESLEQSGFIAYPLLQFCVQNKGKRVFLFDLETTGLPVTRGFNQYYPYTMNQYYDSSRIVQLAYCTFYLGDSTIPAFISSFRKPEDFVVSPKSTEIHGLTTEFLNHHGIPFKTIIDSGVFSELKQCDIIMSHNTGFDVNILCNELTRINYTPPADLWKRVYCSCKLTGYTRLSQLYHLVVKRSDISFHNASEDVRALYTIIQKLFE